MPQTAVPQTLRIASFNLENLDDGPLVRPPLDARIAVLRPQLRRLDADVLCLQEVNAQRRQSRGPRRLLALDRLLEGTPYQTYERAFSLGSGGKAPVDHHNLVTLSRFPIRRWHSLWHERVPPPLVRCVTADPPGEAAPVSWDRPLLQAEIELPDGRSLTVVNLHLRAPLAAPVQGQKQGPLQWRSSAGWAEGFFLATVKRAGQALEARLLVDELFDRDPAALVALCGDFNADLPEPPLRLLLVEAEDSGNAALAARELIALAMALPESRRHSVLHAGGRALYDHLLVSRPLFGAFRGIEIHNEDLGDEGAAEGDSPRSFHAPLVAEFALP